MRAKHAVVNRTSIALGLTCLLLLAPAAAGQAVGIQNPITSTPTDLHFHLIDGRNDFPINTQPVDALHADAPRYGLAENSGSCLPDEAGTLANKEVHTVYGYSSPSIVEYDVKQNGQFRVHPERGLSDDVRLDTSVVPQLRWYLETNTGADEGQPIVVPNVVVQATMREGGAISKDGEAAYNTGNILAQGRTEPSTLAGDATQGPARYIAGERPVYEFVLDMPIQGNVIPKETGYVMRIDIYIDSPACDPGNHNGYVMPNIVRHHTSPLGRPGMSLNVLNPIYITAFHPQFVGDDLVVHTMINSPWGSYDVNEIDGVNFELDGPSVPVTLERIQVEHIRGHDDHFEPLMVVLRWPYKAEMAKDGTYEVRVTAQNDQATAIATGLATFAVGKTDQVCYPDENGRQVCDEKPTIETKETPPVAAPLLLAGIALATMARRRT